MDKEADCLEDEPPIMDGGIQLGVAQLVDSLKAISRELHSNRPAFGDLLNIILAKVYLVHGCGSDKEQ